MTDNRDAAHRCLTTTIAGPDLADFEAARTRCVPKVAKVTPMESSTSCPNCSAPRCSSSARTSSAPARTRFAVHTTAWPGSARRSAPAGVVAASAGNHAQGVALAARELGIKSTIFMPVGVALPKLQATRRYGAEVVLRGHTVDEPLRAAAQFAESDGRC